MSLPIREVIFRYEVFFNVVHGRGEGVWEKDGFALCGKEHSLKGPGEDEFVGFLRYRAAPIEACPLHVELGNRGGKVGF